MSSDDKPIQHVTKAELRQMFNANYLGRIQQGDFAEVITWEKHPCPEGAHEPSCTRSQMVLYQDRTTGDDVMSVHRYLRTDRTIGGFGLPDPKWIMENGVIYKAVTRIETN
jgi:hypothetical protein